MLYLMVVLIIVLDQISKFAAVKYLKGKSPYVIVENFFQLCYVENFGAAFGILQNRKVFFILITSVVILSIVFFLVKYSHSINQYLKFGLIMLLGGAIGNFIDRIRLGYVVDFISFKLGKGYDFPVFNVADMFIVVGTILVMGLILLNKYES
ncbi:signal peptidase II [Schnuerera ultunensis]|uniref:signal peptidase II n=1 Tax=Schnuerera ultunensis TaxID=45497 RepID=UPI00041D4B0C|nr:signal peptidase II [Schnuerera ultunensis]